MKPPKYHLFGKRTPGGHRIQTACGIRTNGLMSRSLITWESEEVNCKACMKSEKYKVLNNG